MRIAFLYIAEAYQCYHGAAIALELATRPGWEVVSYYNDPETPHHLDRIHRAYGAVPGKILRLRRSPLTAALQSIKLLGMFKTLVLRDNRTELEGFDVIVALENSAAPLRDLLTHPRLISAEHGFGDREVSFLPRIAKFDFVLVAGEKNGRVMLDRGLVRPEGYACIGSVKLETGARLAIAEGLPFDRARPVVLYNPHKESKLRSWDRFIEPMLDDFGCDQSLNLIVAPHVKMFRRRSERLRDRWRSRSTRNVLVDPGSDRSVDTSYTVAADIYCGDISSQVYEFLATPRPCVFLNAHRIDWRDNPYFAHWHLGDVVDNPADLMAALRAAPSRHHLYRARQAAMTKAALGDLGPGAASRAADAIIAFMAGEARLR